MTIPTRPEPNTTPITSTIDRGECYEATLQDGTVLWIPKDTENNDCLLVQAWVQDGNTLS